MHQTLHSAIESINALIKEKHKLWLFLGETIAQAEENNWLEVNKPAPEM